MEFLLKTIPFSVDHLNSDAERSKRDVCRGSPSDSISIPIERIIEIFSDGHPSVVGTALWTFAQLGIADLMGEQNRPLTAKELSQLNDNHWHAESLYRLLRVVADTDFIQTIESTIEQDKDDRRPEERVRFQLSEHVHSRGKMGMRSNS